MKIYSKYDLVTALVLYIVFMGSCISQYGFHPLLVITQTIAIVLEYYTYNWINDHWEAKPFLKFTIGLAVLYFLGWELLFKILPNLFVG